ncbi:MAG: hypothetical protein KGH85_08940, partial [Thaumarchaeota archaeon]|nr:hypothetical protein [Nitrososphaerota archaeon]
RNVFKVGYQNDFSEEDFLNLFNACQSNKRLLELVKLRRHQDLLIAYKIMVDDLLPQIKRTKK